MSLRRRNRALSHLLVNSCQRNLTRLCVELDVTNQPYRHGNCFVASIDLESYDLDFACEDHQSYVRSMVNELLARVRIHHFVRNCNREIKEMEQTWKLKVHRKAKKVMHC